VDEPSYELRTSRLRLHALSREEIALALRGERRALSERIGAEVPPTWPESNLAEGLPSIIADMERLPGDERWVWVIIEPQAGAVIGDIGFHGPVAGAASAELGYLIFTEYYGHGYATEASEALLTWAFAQPQVARVIVRIAPDNAASLRVAQKLGMRQTPSDDADYLCFERLAPKESEQA
jgi:RimJ/RimL family protein N-acetyltransferase